MREFKFGDMVSYNGGRALVIHQNCTLPGCEEYLIVRGENDQLSVHRSEIAEWVEPEKFYVPMSKDVMCGACKHFDRDLDADPCRRCVLLTSLQGYLESLEVPEKK